METFIEFISKHAQHAHWFVFGAAILAGFNVPISIDILILLSAFLAAMVVPDLTWHLFFSVLIGCYLSSWCAYWFGRLLGEQLQKLRFFAKLFNPLRMDKIRKFYDKYGLWTLVVGRFIPFGVRNCIFMTTGMSKISFSKFILRDSLACTLWCSTMFYLFFHLGHNYHHIWHYLKTFNLLIFAAFSVTVIAVLWYKNRRKARSTKLSELN